VKAGEILRYLHQMFDGVGKQLVPHSGILLGLLGQHRLKVDFWQLLIPYSYNFNFYSDG